MTPGLTTAARFSRSSELEQAPNFGRYDDVDGDGIPYRTLPGGHPTRGAYFTRGTSRDRFARYTEEGLPYIDNMERLEHKFETARGAAAAAGPQAGGEADADRRSPLRIDRRADGRGPADAGARRAFMSTPCASARFRSPARSLEFIEGHDRIFVVEQNRDAQMRTLISTDLGVATDRWTPILHYNGMPTSARYIHREIAARLRKPVAAQSLEAAE